MALGERRFWEIIPTPAPRQVRKDTWNPTASVRRYRAFRDEVAWRRVWSPNPGDVVVFLMPIPKSWSKRKQLDLEGRPHEQKPDTDNLLKALLDALHGEDSHVWGVHGYKIWSATPGIYIERRPPAIEIPFRL